MPVYVKVAFSPSTAVMSCRAELPPETPLEVLDHQLISPNGWFWTGGVLTNSTVFTNQRNYLPGEGCGAHLVNNEWVETGSYVYMRATARIAKITTDPPDSAFNEDGSLAYGPGATVSLSGILPAIPRSISSYVWLSLPDEPDCDELRAELRDLRADIRDHRSDFRDGQSRLIKYETQLDLARTQMEISKDIADSAVMILAAQSAITATSLTASASASLTALATSAAIMDLQGEKRNESADLLRGYIDFMTGITGEFRETYSSFGTLSKGFKYLGKAWDSLKYAIDVKATFDTLAEAAEKMTEAHRNFESTFEKYNSTKTEVEEAAALWNRDYDAYMALRRLLKEQCDESVRKISEPDPVDYDREQPLPFTELDLPQLADYEAPISYDRVLNLSGRSRENAKGSSDREIVLGNDEANSLRLGGGSDVGSGEGGADTISGGRGADFISGGSGRDRLSGGKGADALFGGGGSDTLIGGRGDDTLASGSGCDILKGGPGSDIFLFRDPGEAAKCAHRITDYEPGIDRINIRDMEYASWPAVYDSLADGSEGLELVVNGQAVLILEDITLAQISSIDFLV